MTERITSGQLGDYVGRTVEVLFRGKIYEHPLTGSDPYSVGVGGGHTIPERVLSYAALIGVEPIPVPPEPMGLGAVVLVTPADPDDIDPFRVVRTEGDSRFPFLESFTTRYSWAMLQNAGSLQVLSEGVIGNE